MLTPIVAALNHALMNAGGSEWWFAAAKAAVATPPKHHVEITHGGDEEQKNIDRLWAVQQEEWESEEQLGWEAAWAAYAAACDTRDERMLGEDQPSAAEAEAGYMRH